MFKGDIVGRIGGIDAGRTEDVRSGRRMRLRDGRGGRQRTINAVKTSEKPAAP